MDAKPHKLRVNLSRVLRDENVLDVPQDGLSKTLHSRNKSTSALNLKGITAVPQRRTAFADVSNIQKPTVQDDIHLSSKIVLQGVQSLKPEQKPITTHNRKTIKDELSQFAVKPLNIQKKAPTAVASTQEDDVVRPSQSKTLLRPAQRPLAAQKALSVDDVDTVATSLSKHSIDDINHEAVPVRKLVTKRKTTVFKETITSHEPIIDSEQEVKSDNAAVPVASEEAGFTTGLAGSFNEDNILPVCDSLLDNVSSEVKDMHDDTHHIQYPCVASRFNDVIDRFGLNAYQPTSTTGYPATELEPELYLPALETQASPSDHDQVEENLPAPSLSHHESESINWDDDEEAFFDAEGFTTARSIQSCGDTTGAMSIVMAPQYTDRIIRELAAAKIWVEENTSPQDVADEGFDCSMVQEYGDEIFDYLRQLEQKMKPDHNYMEIQAEIQWSMRSVLMDWITQVHARFDLLPETLFLAVNYIDRFLSMKVVSLGKLQLVGATAIYVAAKYEEISCPSLNEIVFMVDGGYTVEEITKAERFMLNMLDYNMGWPGPMSFLRRISKADDYDLETRTLAKYFLEVTIMDERFVGCVPSFLAAGSQCLARLMLRKGDWGAAHVHYSQYTYAQLYYLMSTILECCQQPRIHHLATYEKYVEKRFKRASLFVESELNKGFELAPLNRESMSYITSSWRRK